MGGGEKAAGATGEVTARDGLLARETVLGAAGGEVRGAAGGEVRGAAGGEAPTEAEVRLRVRARARARAMS